jgi:hypothetical protein
VEGVEGEASDVVEDDPEGSWRFVGEEGISIWFSIGDACGVTVDIGLDKSFLLFLFG